MGVVKGQERPTATVNRVDVSSVRRASAAPADPERVLFRAYGAETGPGDFGLFKVSRGDTPCVCGGVIRPSNRSIVAAVKAHNATAKHAAWRAWREA